MLRNVRLNQLGTAEMFSDPCGKVRKATEYLPLPRNHLPSFLQEKYSEALALRMFLRNVGEYSLKFGKVDETNCGL